MAIWQEGADQKGGHSGPFVITQIPSEESETQECPISLFSENSDAVGISFDRDLSQDLSCIDL